MRLITKIGITVILLLSLIVPTSVVAADNGVSSINDKLAIEDLIKMTDEELADVSQAIIRGILDDIFKTGEEEVKKYDESAIQRIVNQSISNQIKDAIKSTAEEPINSGKSSGFEIGWSITVNWAEDGGGGTSGFGFKDYDYDINSNESESEVAIFIYGDPTAYAWTGHNFYVTGSGYGLYRVDIGDVSWICTAMMGTCTLKLVVDEWRNGVHSSNDYDMDEYSSPFGYTYSNTFDYSTPFTIPLYAGATYRISIMVVTTCNTYWGAAGADCMSGFMGSWWDTIHLQYVP